MRDGRVAVHVQVVRHDLEVLERVRCVPMPLVDAERDRAEHLGTRGWPRIGRGQWLVREVLDRERRGRRSHRSDTRRADLAPLVPGFELQAVARPLAHDLDALAVVDGRHEPGRHRPAFEPLATPGPRRGPGHVPVDRHAGDEASREAEPLGDIVVVDLVLGRHGIVPSDQLVDQPRFAC